MGACWYCYWGWPEKVCQIYDRALMDLHWREEVLLFGPAHVVWEDENWNFIDECIKGCDKPWNGVVSINAEEMAIVKRSLEELKALPYDEVAVEPEDYEGKHPENYPPPDGVKMRRDIV